MRERFRLSEQELGHKIWTIVQLFYRSHVVFREQFDSYERQVLDLSQRTGIHRNDLRLNSLELSNLLDFKYLERLRDGYIHELKDLCHLVFRGQDRTDLLDRYVSDIFHEISILKEEHYNVKTYAPLYERDAAEVELKHILDEAHALFPHKLRHISYLFGRAQGRLEEHLASFRNIKLFIRSLYLHRHDFVAQAYPDGISQIYRFMYPLGPVEGYFEVGRCFLFSGFEAEALEAFLLARDAWKSLLAGKESLGASRTLTPPERRRRLHAILTPLGAAIARLEKALPPAADGRRVGSVKARSSLRGPSDGAGAGRSAASKLTDGLGARGDGRPARLRGVLPRGG